MSVHISLIDRFLYPHFHRFIQAYERSRDWTRMRCPKCNCPIAFDGATYCAFCRAEIAPQAPVLPEDDCERHTSGIRTVALEEALAIQRAYAEAVAPPETFTGRLRAAMKPGESPMRTYNRMKRGKENNYEIPD